MSAPAPRLLAEKAAGLSDKTVLRSVGIARSTVKEYLDRAAAAGLNWASAAELSEEELDRRLFAVADTRLAARARPDWEAVEKELRPVRGQLPAATGAVHATENIAQTEPPKPPVDRYRAVHSRSPSSRWPAQYHASAAPDPPGSPNPYDAVSPHTARRRIVGGSRPGIGSSSSMVRPPERQKFRLALCKSFAPQTHF